MLVVPRMRIGEPVPTWPADGSMIMPGVRWARSVWTLVTGATSSTAAASTVSTTLPMARRWVPPAVPVTTISSSASASSRSDTLISVARSAVTVAVTVCVPKPRLSKATSWLPAGTLRT